METSTQIIFNRFNRSKISQVATFRVCFIVVAARFQSTLGRTASLCWWYIYLKTQSSSPAMTHLIFSQSKQKQKHLYNLQLHYLSLDIPPFAGLWRRVILAILFRCHAQHTAAEDNQALCRQSSDLEGSKSSWKDPRKQDPIGLKLHSWNYVFHVSLFCFCCLSKWSHQQVINDFWDKLQPYQHTFGWLSK